MYVSVVSFYAKERLSLFLNLKLWNLTYFVTVIIEGCFPNVHATPQTAINQSANEAIHFIIFYYGNTGLADNKIHILYFLERLNLRFWK